jgi:chromosome segregation ATPase
MKRKFFSTLLVGAFFIASMSMFTSCKDYDDDINDLQAQVDKLATAEQLKTSVTDLTAQIAAAKTEAEQKAAAAQTTADAAKTAAATAQATADAAKERVAELEKTGATKAEVAAVQKSLTDAVAQLNTALADKASNADLKAVSDKLDKAIADLDTKATRTELNDAVATINTTISDLQTKLQDVIDTKADKTALADAITKMTAADEELAGKIAKSDAAIAAAQKVAEAAQAAADKAASDAAAALAEAKTELKAAADAAKAAADAAQATADKAATDAKSALDQLDELKKTGASSAELAEAIVAVGKAQAAADAAQAAADAAKSRADAAYDLASKANTTADAAKALAEANALKIQANADSLVSLNAKINALAATVKSLTDADLIKRVTTLESEYEQIQKDFTAIKGAYSTMVTSVNLFTTVEDHMYYWNHRLTFVHVDELDNVFPADKDVADKQYTFKKGQSVTYTDSVLIRVNPATADLKTSNISLINSQGVELGELVKCVDVKPFTQLITRTSAGNGLWVVTFKLNDNYTAEDFEKAVKTDDGRIVYAVAIKNDNANVDANRRVVSEYDLTLGGKNGVQASGDFTVNDVDINEIHNRYFYCDDWTSTENVKELVWTGKPSTTVDEGKNAVDRYKRIDNRQNREILAVVKGEKINISYPTDEPIKGFYVTLDKNFALESAPSEINAWNSYTYENVGKEGVKSLGRTMMLMKLPALSRALMTIISNIFGMGQRFVPLAVVV